MINTINRINPEVVNHIYKYDEFKGFIDDQYEMQDKLVSMLVRFLEQNSGTLSKSAKGNEFPELKDDEVEKIENTFYEFLEI